MSNATSSPSSERQSPSLRVEQRTWPTKGWSARYRAAADLFGMLGRSGNHCAPAARARPDRHGCAVPGNSPECLPCWRSIRPALSLLSLAPFKSRACRSAQQRPCDRRRQGWLSPGLMLSQRSFDSGHGRFAHRLPPRSGPCAAPACRARRLAANWRCRVISGALESNGLAPLGDDRVASAG